MGSTREMNSDLRSSNDLLRDGDTSPFAASPGLERDGDERGG